MWTPEEDRIIMKNRWAYPAMMGMIRELLKRRHSTEECLKRFEELHDIQPAVVPRALLPRPPPPQRKKPIYSFYFGARGVCLKKEACDFSHADMATSFSNLRQRQRCPEYSTSQKKKDFPTFMESKDQSANHNCSKDKSSGGKVRSFSVFSTFSLSVYLCWVLISMYSFVISPCSLHILNLAPRRLLQTRCGFVARVEATTEDMGSGYLAMLPLVTHGTMEDASASHRQTLIT